MQRACGREDGCVQERLDELGMGYSTGRSVRLDETCSSAGRDRPWLDEQRWRSRSGSPADRPDLALKSIVPNRPLETSAPSLVPAFVLAGVVARRRHRSPSPSPSRADRDGKPNRQRAPLGLPEPACLPLIDGTKTRRSARAAVAGRQGDPRPEHSTVTTCLRPPSHPMLGHAHGERGHEEKERKGKARRKDARLDGSVRWW